MTRTPNHPTPSARPLGTCLEQVLGHRHLDELCCLGVPIFDHAIAPLDQVVHVLEELIPGHDTRGGVRRHEAWALGALWVGADLLAHVLADACELVLKLSTVLHVLAGACRCVVLDLDELGGLCVPALDLT